MRPIKLDIEGINSFDERQTLDFDRVGRSKLFCICGKTGAGKSTIFDCLMFAVYGKSNKGDLADIVNLSRTSAFVGLDFSEGESVYRVERSIKCRYEKDADGNRTDRRIPETDCMLYRDGAPIAKGKEATAALREIVGLDAGEFKNVYLLEQGEYAEFLKKPPAKQTEAVGKIFSLMRFGDVHKLAADGAKREDAEAANVDARISDLGDASPDALRAAKTELSALRAKNTALIKDMDGKRSELDALEARRLEYAGFVEKQRAVRAHAERLAEEQKRLRENGLKLDEFLMSHTDDGQARIAELRAQSDRLIALGALDREYKAAAAQAEQKAAAAEQKAQAQARTDERAAELNARMEAAFDAFEAATESFRAAAFSMARRSETVERAVKRLCDGERAARAAAVDEAIFELREEKNRFDALDARRADIEKAIERSVAADDAAKRKIEIYAAEEKAAAAVAAAAKRTDADAREKLAQATVLSHAAAVRSELHAGDVCPVCGGVYGGGACGGDADLGAVKAAADRAAAELKDAEQKANNAAAATERARTEYAASTRELESARSQLAEIKAQLEATLVVPEAYTRLATAIKTAKERGAEFIGCEREVEAHAAAAAVAAAERKAADDAAREAADNAAALRAKLGDGVGATDAMLKAVADELQALEKKQADDAAKKAELVAAVEGARAAAAAVKATLEAAQAECPVDMPEFDGEAYDNKRAIFAEMSARRAEQERDIAVREEALRSLSERCERLKSLADERALHVKRRDDLHTIAEITRGKAMLNYVAAEYIEQFTAIASGILSDLSGGKYTMGYDKENGFTVADFLNDGKSRKTDTLSGGELFLASLAVAIAIARSESNGNNAFFFLDEGFGTLDDELIDVVYGALESLSTDCLVGVISHSGSLIDRMPSCVEIKEATDTSGSRIVY